MKKDPVIDGLVAVKHFVTTYQKQLSFVVTAVVIAVVAGVWIKAGMQRTAGKARETFGAGISALAIEDIERATTNFRRVVKNFPKSPHAAYSGLLLGNYFLREGSYDSALAYLTPAAAGGDETVFVPGFANEALGICYEELGKSSEALSSYENALNDENVRHRHCAIRWKMALLLRDTDQYDRVSSLCRAIVEDTLAAAYRRKAENILTELKHKQQFSGG